MTSKTGHMGHKACHPQNIMRHHHRRRIVVVERLQTHARVGVKMDLTKQRLLPAHTNEGKIAVPNLKPWRKDQHIPFPETG